MKVVIATLNYEPDGPSGGPQVHADGCADIARGVRSGKYGSATPIDVETLEGAALWIYSNHISSGEMAPDSAQCSTRYMPCTRGRC